MGGRASATEAVAPTRSAGGQAHSIVDLAVGQRLGPRQRGLAAGATVSPPITFTSGVVAKLASASATDRSPGSARTCAAPDDRNRTRAEPDAGAGVSSAVDEQEARRTSEPAPPLRQAKAAAPSRLAAPDEHREPRHARPRTPCPPLAPPSRARFARPLRGRPLTAASLRARSTQVRCADRAKDGTKSRSVVSGLNSLSSRARSAVFALLPRPAPRPPSRPRLRLDAASGPQGLPDAPAPLRFALASHSIT